MGKQDIENCNIIITNHSEDRMIERAGLNKRSVYRMAEKAYYNGISHSETKGSLYRYMSSVVGKSQKEGCAVRIYGQNVYVFLNSGEFDEEGNLQIILITMFGIPNRLRAVANGVSKRKQALAIA